MGKGSRKKRNRRKKKAPPGGPALRQSTSRAAASTSLSSSSSSSSRTGVLTVVLCVVFLGLLPFLGGGYMLAGALGVVGRPGVFTATRCSVVGTGKGRYVACDGNLVAGHRSSSYATVDTRLPLGRATPVRVLPGGPLETLGPAAVSGWSTVALGGLTVLTAGALGAFRGRLRGPVRDTVFRVLGVPAGLTLGGLVVYVVVEIVT